MTVPTNLYLPAGQLIVIEGLHLYVLATELYCAVSHEQIRFVCLELVGYRRET